MEADYLIFCEITDDPWTMSLGNCGLGGSLAFICKYFDALFLGRSVSVGGVRMQVRKTFMFLFSSQFIARVSDKQNRSTRWLKHENGLNYSACLSWNFRGRVIQPSLSHQYYRCCWKETKHCASKAVSRLNPNTVRQNSSELCGEASRQFPAVQYCQFLQTTNPVS
jgi:hypothetical protein